MKRVRLIKQLTEMGCVLVRHGGKHDWYRNQTTGVLQPVPRHREINERLAKHIIKVLSPPSASDSNDQNGARQNTN
jgi:mRNA interferase HicA